MSAFAWPYPAPPGIREEIHQRFAAVVQRATVREALPALVFASDDEADVAGAASEVDGGGRSVEYPAGEEAANA